MSDQVDEPSIFTKTTAILTCIVTVWALASIKYILMNQ